MNKMIEFRSGKDLILLEKNNRKSFYGQYDLNGDFDR